VEYFFLFLFLLAPVGLVVGLAKPNHLESVIKRSLTRAQNAVLYIALACIGFIGFGVTATDIPSESADTVAPTPAADSDAALPVVSPQPTDSSAGSVPDTATDASYTVLRVIDGDTIEVVMNGEKKTVRYIGINTPETVHPSKPVECFGKEASEKNKALVEGKRVRLVKDVSETDSYGRLLRYVYVDDVFVNRELVAGGYANAYTYPPDVAFAEEFRAAEVFARENKRGLWGDVCTTGGDTNAAQASPAISPAPAKQTTTGQCTIKGNINAEGEKIYHMIGCQSYSRTVIDESAGEEWFCSESEAQSAGWRKALNC
jgi:micrococcal nuclease